MDKPGYYMIGDLVRTFGLPASALRYYDREGIFVPSHRDPDTGYRYYTSDQFVTLDIIMFLMELGFPANKIGDIVGRLDTRADLIRDLEIYSRELDETVNEIMAKREKLRQVFETFATIDNEVYVVKEKTLPERRLDCRPIGARITDEERKYKFKQVMGSKDPRKEPSVEMLSMGAISSLERFRCLKTVEYKYFCRETADGGKTGKPGSLILPAGVYLTINFINLHSHRLSAYDRLLLHIDEHGLDVEDMLVELFPVVGLPPVTPDEELVQVQIRLK